MLEDFLDDDPISDLVNPAMYSASDRCRRIPRRFPELAVVCSFLGRLFFSAPSF